jgi:signal transduction histidine kinase
MTAAGSVPGPNAACRRGRFGPRLYLRIWIAILVSLFVFAVAAGLLWHWFADFTPRAQQAELIAQQAETLLAGKAPGDEALVIERLAGRTRADLALFAADGRRLAQAGRPLPPPEDAGGAWRPGHRGPPAWTLPLSDGRQLVVRPHPIFGGPRGERWGGPPGGPPGGFIAGLLLAALVVGAATYPIVRRLTRRLERLQAAVESLGRGDLSARVTVEGHDEVARLAASFNDSAARIEQLLASHRLLLANASHELRTPLARVRVGLELLAADPSPERRAEIERDIGELDELVDEILLSSRLDAQPKLDRVEEVDVLGLAAELAGRYPEAGVSGQPCVIRADRRLLARLLGNLLENARRHGRPPVTVEVECLADAVRIRVTDTGDGIAAADRGRLFEPFQRLEGRSAGTGLGLSLVRTIARLHGGDVRIEDGVPAGTRFVVELPMAPPGH